MKGKWPLCKVATCEAERLEPVVSGHRRPYQDLRWVCPKCGATYATVPAKV